MNQREAAAKIAERATELVEMGWTQGCAARDRAGDHCSPLSSRACTFCITGAINRASMDLVGSLLPDQRDYDVVNTVSEVVRAVEKVIGTTTPGDVPIWNDKLGRTQGDAVWALKAATELLGG